MPSKSQESSVIDKVTEAKAKRSKKKSKSNFQYQVAIGGGIGCCVLAAICSIPGSGPSTNKGSRSSPLDAYVNNKANINAVTTSAEGNFTAAASPFFDSWTYADVKWGHSGITLSNMVGVSGAVQYCENDEDVEGGVIPPSYDARDSWPSCFGPVQDSGNCTAGYAIAAAESLAARFCIAEQDKYDGLRLSAQQILSCDKKSRGCKGGGVDNVWAYIQRRGLYPEDCVPYTGKSSTPCKTDCDESKKLKVIDHCVLSHTRSIKREIYNKGPVVAPLSLHSEYLVYSSGVYTPTDRAARDFLSTSDGKPILQAVIVLGWGKSEGNPYWIVRHSWGSGWGEDGYARVSMGTVLQENYFVVGSPGTEQAIKVAEEKKIEEDRRREERRRERAEREERLRERREQEAAEAEDESGAPRETKTLEVEYSEEIASSFENPLEQKLEDFARENGLTPESWQLKLYDKDEQEIVGAPKDPDQFPVNVVFTNKEGEKKTLNVEYTEEFDVMFEQSPLEKKVEEFAQEHHLTSDLWDVTPYGKDGKPLPGNGPRDRHDFPVKFIFTRRDGSQDGGQDGMGNHMWTQSGIDKITSDGMFETYGSPEVGSPLPQALEEQFSKDGTLEVALKQGWVEPTGSDSEDTDSSEQDGDTGGLDGENFESDISLPEGEQSDITMDQ